MALHQIVYTSHSQVPMTREDLITLLDGSRKTNAQLGVTGLLLHADGSFMQVIEGEFVPVEGLFARIQHDPRHGGVIQICNEPIASRSFADWSMAFREITAEAAAGIPGFRRFFGPDLEKSTGDDSSIARRILLTFASTMGLDERG